MFEGQRKLTTEEKALRINLNQGIYGSFAEIGAGQEVSANFFRAGASSGTIAYSISAYDMKISDSIYGNCARYVSQQRLETMLKHEFNNVEQKLPHRDEATSFFAFANTVEALNYHKTNQGRGWLGIRFQLSPDQEPNECVIHVKMLDPNNRLQQEALGILGVNLVDAAYYLNDDIDKFIISLMDRLEDRVEIDFFKIKGPDFKEIDNRLMALKLVKFGLTEATMFHPSGKVLQPQSELYKKNILLLRGRFRPTTLVNTDMLNRGLKSFLDEDEVNEKDTRVLFELTLKDLRSDGDIDDQDFLDRVEILGSIGHTVMVSNYQKFYKVVDYLSSFTKGRKIGVVLGVHNLQTIFEEKYYENLAGGIFEAFGLGFGKNMKLYVYPAKLNENNELYKLDNFVMSTNLRGLFQVMMDNNRMQAITIDETSLDHLDIYSDKVLEMIRNGIPGWETMVPPEVEDCIKENKLLGYEPSKVFEEI